MSQVISETIAELLRLNKHHQPINVARVKNLVSQRYGLRRTPKLVELIAAVPDQFRAALQSVLTAKPIRTASGVSS